MTVQRKLFIIGTTVLVLLLIHQNCARSFDPRDKKIASLAAESPFAYDTTFNRLGYLSCSDMATSTTPHGQYFTFRIAAKGSSGVKISDAFRGYVQIYDYPTQYDVLTDAANDLNENVIPVLAIRPTPNNLLTYKYNEENPDASADNNLTDALDSPNVVDILFPLPAGERRNTFSDDFGDSLPFQGSIGFFSSEEQHEDIRTDFEDGGLLTLTYSGLPGDDPITPRGVNMPQTGNSGATAYGVGLSFSFTNGNKDAKPERMLATVSEKNLATKSNQGTWKCDEDMKFVVVPHLYNSEDVKDDKGKLWFNGICTNTKETAENKERLQRIRDVLGNEEEWIVDLNKKCVVPVNEEGAKSCYGDLTKTVHGNVRIDYNGDDPDCNAEGASFIGSTTPLCPHYLTICYRVD